MTVVNVSAGYPELELEAGSTITVTLDDPAAKITRLNVYAETSTPSSSSLPTLPVLLGFPPPAE